MPSRPGRGARHGSSAFARPKSSTFTDAVRRRDLDVRGLQIAVDDPLLVSRFERLGDLLRNRERVVERNRALRDRSASVGPSTSSMTNASMPSESSSPWMCAMCGWFSDASICASRWNRASRSGSVAKSPAEP